MITVELTEMWDGITIESCYTPNEERICEKVRELVAGRYRMDPSDYWTWTLCRNGDEIIDFGSHTFFARVKGISMESPKDTKAVLEEQKEKRSVVAK